MEDGLEEEVSEAEDNTEYNLDQEIIDGEECGDEEDDCAEAAVTFKLKIGPYPGLHPHQRIKVDYQLKMTPGPPNDRMKYAVSRIDDIKHDQLEKRIY